MPHHVVLIDAEQQANESHVRELVRLGFRAESFGDSSELIARAAAGGDTPDLVVLCIDPKPAGWAVCDRIRKTDGLRGVSIIITSAEASEADFEAHRKLKKRADDYLRKPVDPKLLVIRVAAVIGSPTARLTQELDIPLEEEIAVDEVELSAEPEEFNPQDFEDSTQAKELDVKRAFAASHEAEQPARARTKSSPTFAQAEPFDSPTTSSGVDLDFGLDEVARQSTAAPATQPAKEGDFRRERDNLLREVEELRAKAAARPEAGSGSNFSREKEFLNLREIINKKEKEILDLRDSLDAKERLILDGKDKLREADRNGRDLDSRMLGTERELVEARELIENLGKEKTEVLDRERALKAQLGDIKERLGKSEQELESWKQRHAQALTKSEEDLRALTQSWEKKNTDERADLERQRKEELSAAEQRRKGEATAAEARRVDELEKQSAGHKAELEQVLRENLKEKEQLEADHANALAAVEDAHGRELSENEAKKMEELQSLRQLLEHEHELQLAAARESHARKIQELEEAHTDQKAGMQARFNMQLDEVKKQTSDLEQQLSDEQTGSKSKSERIAVLESQLGSALQQAKEKDGHIKERDQRIEELEGESAQYQEQILKAYQRIKNDENVVTRAKKAMAIAITLLDENGIEKEKPST